MNEVTSSSRETAIAKLRATMAESKAGDLSDGLCFEWHDSMLDIDMRLCASSQRKIEEACRMAIVLLTAASNGTLLSKGEKRIEISCSDSSTNFAIFGESGSPIMAGENWSDLVEIHETGA